MKSMRWLNILEGKKDMSKWSVDYKVAGEHGWKNMNGIEAVDGKEAIEYVKKHVIGVYKFQCFHDVDECKERSFT